MSVASFAGAALVALFSGCGDVECQWRPPPTHEDLSTCNQARAGGSDVWVSSMRFADCLRSFGYVKQCKRQQ
jgi:hypothetical protein